MVPPGAPKKGGSNLARPPEGRSPLVILLFGPPGSGKGTQAAYIVSRLHIPSISTGDMLRTELQLGTPLGNAAAAVISSGGLVSDDLVNAMLAERLLQPDCRDGFLLDGYPRTVSQAVFLDAFLSRKGLPQPLVIHLDVPEESLISRISSRRQCPTCGRIYNLLHNPPKLDELCDLDATPLVRRKDDQEEVVRERLRAFEEITRMVESHYTGGCYHKLDGDRPAEEVSADIGKILSQRASSGVARSEAV